MTTYRQLMKGVDTNNYIQTSIDIRLLQAQYNPSRFRFWKSLHKGPPKEILNMLYSPHYRFLKSYIQYQNTNFVDTSYYKLQKSYGKKDKWIMNKIEKFIRLFDDIKNGVVIDEVIVLSSPLVINDFNSGYEIFEGHHRVACYLFLERKFIDCKVIR